MTFEEDVDRSARRAALENALKHGAANPGAVTGRVMSEVAEGRSRAKEVGPIVARVVAEVNALSADARPAALAELGGAAAKREKEATGPLKALPNAEKGKVVLRFAPNPSGPPHFGHGRGMVISWTYREMYDGKLLLRFDDTDTTVKPPWMPAYAMFPESFEWLCGKPDRIVFASDRMEKYTDWALELIRRGGAYVCECEGDVFRALKEKGEACPHRELSREANEQKFKTMVDGGFRRGAAVLRVKTDIAHKDPAMRDWVAFRIAEEPHPRLAALGKPQHAAWPLLDFQSAIDDHLEGVTHIVRGKDLRDSTGKQEFVYAHLGWTYPETLYWGRVSVHEFGKFSKSILTEAIAKGGYTGWDDPRLPTFPALRRRGFQPEAIRNFWLSFGITEKDIAASAVTLEAENRKVVEPRANRYFFVADPVELRIDGAPMPLAARAPLHPDHPERGYRQHAFVGDLTVLVRRDEAAPGKLRLKDLANVDVHAGHHARYLGNDLAFLKEPGVRIVQWAPIDGVETSLMMPDATVVTGIAERQLLDEPVGAVVQLERVGFARVDAKTGDSVGLYFSHK
ncbi:MAG: glutamate--tRNA ligase [Thermoplasmatota archaeon]